MLMPASKKKKRVYFFWAGYRCKPRKPCKPQARCLVGPLANAIFLRPLYKAAFFFFLFPFSLFFPASFSSQEKSLLNAARLSWSMVSSI